MVTTTPCTKWKSRKFWASVGSIGLFTVLLVTKNIDQDVFKSLSMIILGGYFMANVADKKVK